MLDNVGIPGFGRRRRKADYRHIFESVEGRRVLADLYRFCGMMRPSFVAGRPDETAFNEGKRRVFLRLAGFMELDDERIRTMAGEAPDDAGLG